MRSHDHEHLEADSLRPKAARIDERPDPTLWRAAVAGRADVAGPEGMLRLQRVVRNGGVQRLAQQETPVLDVLDGGSGSALDEPVRRDMESRLGADFSDVRVHTGDEAHSSARSVNAHAYTVGSNIVFQRDRFDPSSTEGRTTLAHELTHVIQQRSGPVDGTPTDGGVRVSDPSDRFERDAASNAERVMSAPTASTVRTSGDGGAASSAPAVGVQREDAEEESVRGLFVQREEEEESVQGLFVQRDEGEEEESQG